MIGVEDKVDVIKQLQRDVLSLQGFRKMSGNQLFDSGLGIIENAFPDNTFSLGVIHEFISNASEAAAATNGFIGGIVGRLMLHSGACLWIGTKRTLFPPSLKIFGIEPHRIVFIDVSRPKDALWAVEEALKSEGLAAVVGELSELSFTESRRLQLAVEHSHVTGFIHRQNPKAENTVACTTRWKIQPHISRTEQGMPGVGLPMWDVQLLKVRNGRPGSWQLEWSDNGFQHIPKRRLSIPGIQTRKTG